MGSKDSRIIIARLSLCRGVGQEKRDGEDIGDAGDTRNIRNFCDHFEDLDMAFLDSKRMRIRTNQIIDAAFVNFQHTDFFN